MPRDLFAQRDVDSMPMLEKSEQSTAQAPHDDNSEYKSQRRGSKDKIERDMDKQDAWAEIKPYTKSLTPSDVEACVKLEDATFPPQERATREKFLYRFTKCGELCLGLFTSARTDGSSEDVDPALPTASVAHAVSSSDPDRKLIMLAHCVATKSANEAVLDGDMEVPTNWRESGLFESSGHNEQGRTICIHSLAVLPAYQGKGLGSTLMKAYIQRIEQSQAADRIALLAHGELVGFYQTLGFKSIGPSKAQFGGGGWVDMIFEIKANNFSHEDIYHPNAATAHGTVSTGPVKSPGPQIHPPRSHSPEMPRSRGFKAGGVNNLNVRMSNLDVK